MGMDLIEISMHIEKTFGVEFPLDDFGDMFGADDVTVGHLYERILNKLHLRDVGRYHLNLNFQFWRGMRLALHSATGVEEDRILLQTPLAELFPRTNRRGVWTDLTNICPWKIPELDYPRMVSVVGLAVAGCTVVIDQFQIWQIPGLNALWPILGLIGLWVFFETYVKFLSFCARWRIRLPSGMTTVKDLCRHVLAVNYRRICETTGLAAAEEPSKVWEKLVEILCETLDVESGEVTFNSRLVQDLGAS